MRYLIAEQWWVFLCAGTAIGILSGATLGSIIGSYVTEDTYIIIAEVNIGVVEQGGGDSKTTIIFSSSDIQEHNERTGLKHFRERLSTRISVYAGGRNVKQYQIAAGVRQRFGHILSDII